MARIYLISPQEILNIHEFVLQLEEMFASVEREERPAVFQLRLKNVVCEQVESTMLKIIPVCVKFGVDFVINDDLTLALKHGVGVHVGGSDANLEELIAFKKAGGGHLGVSCYDEISRAKEFEAVANCISFGAMFLSETKPHAKACGLNVVKDYAKHNLTSGLNREIAIIGGINAENMHKLLEILPIVNYVCVVSCVWQ